VEVYKGKVFMRGESMEMYKEKVLMREGEYGNILDR